MSGRGIVVAVLAMALVVCWLVVSSTTKALADPSDPPGVFAHDVIVGEPIELPEGMALVIETGCFHCDGFMEALYRASRPVGGALDVAKLFEADRSAFASAYITSFAMRPDASDMVVAVCTKGYCGGLHFAEPSSEATFYRSQDFGMNWSVLAVAGEAREVIAVTDAGIVVGPGPSPDFTKAWLIDGTLLKPLAGAYSIAALSRRNGEVLWWNDSSHEVQRGDGSRVVTQPESRYGPDVATNAGQPPLSFWGAGGPIRPSGGFGGYYLTVEAMDGSEVGLRLGGDSAAPAQWLDERHILATIELTTRVFGPGVPPLGFRTGAMTPSIVDIYSGQVQPISGIAGEGPISGIGRNRVQAVYRLPTDSPCLPVRDRWKQTASVIGCAVASSLRATGERRYGDAVEWRGVWLADGRSGWVEAAGLP